MRANCNNHLTAVHLRGMPEKPQPGGWYFFISYLAPERTLETKQLELETNEFPNKW